MCLTIIEEWISMRTSRWSCSLIDCSRELRPLHPSRMLSKLTSGGKAGSSYQFTSLLRKELPIVSSLCGLTGRLRRDLGLLRGSRTISTELKRLFFTSSSLFIKIWMRLQPRSITSTGSPSSQWCLTSTLTPIKFICKCKKTFLQMEVFQADMPKSVCQDGLTLPWKFQISWPPKMWTTC